MKVIVAQGGKTSEREISLITGKAVFNSLIRLEHHPVQVDLAFPDFVETIKSIRPDLVFIASHGKYAEDGSVQGLFEILGINYTHTGVMGSAIAMNKWVTKNIASNVFGIPVPKGMIISSKKELLTNPSPMDGMFVVKPNDEGSSINVFIYDGRHAFDEVNYPFKSDVIVEEFIDGQEIHAAVVKGKFVGALEIEIKTEGFYDYQAKYFNDKATHIKPPRVPDSIVKLIEKYTMSLYNFLGCRGATRADFIYDPKRGIPFFLEFNTHPGLTPKSLVPELANFYLGWHFDDLIAAIIEDV